MFTSYTKNNKITDDRKLKNLSLLDLTKIATPENPLVSYVNMGEPNFEMLIQKDVENMENMAFYAIEKPKNKDNDKT